MSFNQEPFNICLPNEILDMIFKYTDNERFVLPFINILSYNTIKHLYKDKNIDNECERGNLKIIKILFKIGKDCTTYAMDFASANGNLEVVKYLHEIKKKCTTNAIDRASKNGYLEVIKYLFEIKKKCTTNAIDSARKNGHLEIVRHLLEIKENFKYLILSKQGSSFNL